MSYDIHDEKVPGAVPSFKHDPGGRTVPSPVTERMLLNWAGEKKFQEGRALFLRDAVSDIEYEPPVVRGQIVSGSRVMRTAFRLRSDGSAESLCPCYENRERGIICSHVIALGLALRHQLNDPEILRRRAEERRRSETVARQDEQAYLRRAGPGQWDATPASVELHLPPDWMGSFLHGRLSIGVRIRVGTSVLRYADAPRAAPCRLNERDEALLYVMEDVAGGPLGEALELGPADLHNVLDLMRGRSFHENGNRARIAISSEPLSTRLRVTWIADRGELTLTIEPCAPADASRAWTFFAHARNAWATDGSVIRPVLPVLPDPMLRIYAHAVTLPRMAVPRFLRAELPALRALIPVETDVTEDLFTIEPANPLFRLNLRGSLASLSAVLQAEYDGVRLVAGKTDPAGHFAIPDPADLLRYTVRNGPCEAESLVRLSALGFSGTTGDQLSPLIGERKVLNFMARHVPALRRAGWKVQIEGRAGSFLEESPLAVPVVRISSSGEGRWFEVDFHYEDARGASLTSSEIARAIRMGESFVEKDGTYVLFDAGAVESLRDVFDDCATTDGSRPGAFRISGLYAAYVRDALHALDGVDIEADAGWRDAVQRLSSRPGAVPGGSPPVPDLPGGLGERLRPYQMEGVQWLRYLEHCGFAGILADEMGLGKTIQGLAWISMERLLPEARGRPALIVCPTSLVENWAAEAARFTPGLNVRMISGQDRHQNWDRLDEADVLITSYALMRRDIDRYADIQFSIVILDEAQHIKNRATQNALSAKRLRAHHRLVMTGTPMENGISDLWSIMDFLMPGYLGPHERFRKRYEAAVAGGGEAGDQAQARLRFKLRPFLLRRMKKEVARELPPKVQRIAYCTLTGDQQRVYQELLDHSRRRVTELVKERGFDASRMEILRLLLRLRQTCCHLGLLKLENLQSEFPSAKTDLLMELLQEAIDGGHRVLLFSQFVSMLTLLRAEMEKQAWAYCYLDGATQNRLEVVRRFNTDRSIPLFLISLKAGGTGLNLTGADMVIHFDPWWNPAVEDQATDRAYRIGQQKMVYSVKLIARGTVEERVLSMQRRKQQMIDATIRPGGEPLHRMSWEDVRSLLDM